jgi:hypothetical protein
MTIAMGLISNYPFALAAGLGINGIVAFGLTARGLSPAGAMGVIVIEGLVITLLVVLGLREAIMNAVPIALKRAIWVGIGLFILFIGFANGGLIKAGSGTLVTISYPTTPSQFVFIIGLVITFAHALKVRGAGQQSSSRRSSRPRRRCRCSRRRRTLHAGRSTSARQDARPAHRDPDDLRHHAHRLLRTRWGR